MQAIDLKEENRYILTSCFLNLLLSALKHIVILYCHTQVYTVIAIYVCVNMKLTKHDYFSFIGSDQ